MNPEMIFTPRSLRLLAYFTLLIGLSVGIVVFLTQPSIDSDIIGYENLGGISYPIRKSESRKLRYQLEKTGGKFAVWEDEASDFFSDLWKGRRLGETIVVLSVIVCSGLLFLAKLNQLLEEARVRNNHNKLEANE